MLKEFKDFILRGNVVSMAVGIVIGVAFGAIVTSLVNDIIMPPIGLVLGNVDFSNLYVVLREGEHITEEEVLDFCKEHLAGYKRPRSVEFIDDFPRTATGKILKRILRKPYWEGQERQI